MDAPFGAHPTFYISIWRVLNMKRTAYISAFASIVALLCSCGRLGICQDDELTIAKSDYKDTQLRIDGYFFGDTSPDSNTAYANIFFLYRNGIFFTSEAEDLDRAEKGTIDVDIENSYGKQIKGLWGLFQAKGDVIEIERWLTRIDGCEETIYELGIILNDTMIVITRREYRDNGKVKLLETPNSTFYFRPLQQKPDSTSPYIE